MLKYNFYQIRIIFYRLQSTNWRKIRNNISNVWTIYQLSYTYATWFCVECSLSLFSSFHIFHYLVIIFWRKNVFIILLKKERKWICFCVFSICFACTNERAISRSKVGLHSLYFLRFVTWKGEYMISLS